MEIAKKRSADKFLHIAICVLIVLFLFGIVWVNLNSAQWYNFDIYADAMVAKYMAESHSLFPEGWTFGNQIYVVTTSVLAAFLYPLLSDTVLSLSVASCIMTCLIVMGFVWCIRPFVSKKAQLVGVLCLIGGTIFGFSAATDTKGLQIFYTMASYYACYVIGILFTLGIWIRLHFAQRVGWLKLGICMFLNFALGMQSLREALILNIPLCALAALCLFVRKKNVFTKANMFVLGALAANLLGVVSLKLLGGQIRYAQIDILKDAGGDIFTNIFKNSAALLGYIGLIPKKISAFEIFKLGSSLVLIGVVGYAVICSVKSRNRTPISYLILFCLISLTAVFCAGAVIILTRSIYYFVWYLLVALSFVYLAEHTSKNQRHQCTLLAILILIASGNLFFHFKDDVMEYSESKEFYQEVTQTLLDDGITHVYYDESTIFTAPRIAAFSDDALICGGFRMNMLQPDTQDLLTHIKYLCSMEWFDSAHAPHSYIMLSGKTFEKMDTAELQEYRQVLMLHLTLVHHFTYAGEEYYFYSFSEPLFQDLVSER